jgi:hypothetical protein
MPRHSAGLGGFGSAIPFARMLSMHLLLALTLFGTAPALAAIERGFYAFPVDGAAVIHAFDEGPACDA